MKRSLPLLFLALAAHATTLIAVDVPTLAKTSDYVVIATVKSSAPRWTSDNARIITDVTVEVTEGLKGIKSGSLVVMVPGGEIGDVGQRVDGVPGFFPGEVVVLFLEKRGSDRAAVNGMAQGKFRVEVAADGSLVATPDAEGHALLLDPTTRKPISGSKTPIPLEKLKTQIREALAVPAEPSNPVSPKLPGLGTKR